MPIRVLEDYEIKRMRAGEVIERPASLVKELIENSLDAGATKITIRISPDGGRELIQVFDNGSGMSQLDLEKCLLPHATSKFKKNSEPGSGITLGFRGEALASACVFANVTVSSKELGQDGWRVSSVGGRILDGQPCSQQVGTTVEVKNLFFAHPPRLAFLKSARHEITLVRQCIENLALVYPNVAFEFWSGNRPVDYLVNTSESRIATILGQDFVQNSIAVYDIQDGITVSGRVSLPTWSGKSSLGQRFFINGRPLVRDKILSSALRSLWNDVSTTLPSCLLEIQCDPNCLDVNVHPAKLEVRFKDEKKIFAIVKSILQKALLNSGPISASSLSRLAKRLSSPLDMSSLNDEGRMPLGNCIGIILGNYIVSETSNGMIMVDAHAAHERIVYEKLKEYVRQGCLKDMSAVIQPVIMNVRENIILLETSQDILSDIGIMIQFLDSSNISIYQVPSFVPPHEVPEMMQAIISNLKNQEDVELEIMSLMDRLCADIACRVAFRTGDDIVEDFGNALLREMELTPNSAQCQHGRPTAIELTASQIASLFGRNLSKD